MRQDESTQAYHVKITADSKITIEHHNFADALDIKRWKQPENKRALKPTAFVLSDYLNHHHQVSHKEGSPNSKHKDTPGKHPNKHPLSQPAIVDNEALPHNSPHRLRATQAPPLSPWVGEQDTGEMAVKTM